MRRNRRNEREPHIRSDVVGATHPGHEDFHRDITSTRSYEDETRDGYLLDTDLDEAYRFGANEDADERRGRGIWWHDERGTDYGSAGRHARGFNSTGRYDPGYGQTLGHGNWRSVADEGVDRSGRAGIVWEDLERESIEPDEEGDESLAREDFGGMVGDVSSGLSRTQTWSAKGRPAGPFSGRGPRGYRRSDERILDEYIAAITDDPHLDATQVEAVVSDGDVTLTGTVPDRFSKRLAEDLAIFIPGVRDVNNRLRVAREEIPESKVSDDESRHESHADRSRSGTLPHTHR